MARLKKRQGYIPQHKYAINSAMLGDTAQCAWSNLGLWQTGLESYPDACQALAMHLADAIHLHAHDRLLDLGCGQGASLKLWQMHYQVQGLSAVELQAECVEKIRKNLSLSGDLYCDSFLNLNHLFPQECFDAILCLDAAYHSNLNVLLESCDGVLNSKGRIGIHYLVLSENFLNLNQWQRWRYRYLLKAADIDLANLSDAQATQHKIEQAGFQILAFQNISAEVFAGFAAYGKSLKFKGCSLDQFKIQMTAKLCQKLYEDGLIYYVAIAAQKR